MYGFLLRFLPKRMADLAMVLWYAGLTLLVLYFAGLPKGNFEYLAV